MAEAVVLVEDGRARCAVEVAAEASVTELRAGEELVRYLERLGGASVDLHRGSGSGAPVRILVGGRARDEVRDLPVGDLRDDGFLLHVSPEAIALVGANDRGTLYAAYELIERLGVRWYWPGPENEYLPEVGDLTLRAGTEVINPSFRFRLARGMFAAMVGVGGYPRSLWQALPSPWKEQVLDWGVKNRLNTIIEYPGLTEDSLGEDDISAYFVDRGGVAGVDSVHASLHMVDPDVYFDSHPEYFAMNEKGERVKSKYAHNCHLCLSNPDVIDLVVREALKSMERNPEAGLVSITQADGIDCCQCPACLANCDQGNMRFMDEEYLIRTNDVIRYANRVAERFCETWPDRYVYVLAYFLTMPPPTIPVHPNVLVQVTHSLGDHCVFNRPLSDPVGNHRLLHDDIKGWEDSGAKLWFYDYNPVSSMAQAPYPVGRKFHEDVKWLHAHNFIGYHSQSEGTMWGLYGLNHVSLARTLWDVGVDFDALQRDYFRCLYGSAAEPVQALHEALERALVEYEPLTVGLGAYLSPEVVGQARGLLREAREAEASDAVQTRLGMLDAQVEYGARLAGASRMAAAYRRTRDADMLKQLKEERDAILSYIEAHPVDGAYHLGGIDNGIDIYLIEDHRLLSELAREEEG